MSEYTLAAIAVKCNRSERQVVRWIRSGKLKARRIGESNRYEVSDEDLVPFLPQETTDQILDRLEALELKISRLEAKNLDIHLDHIKASESALTQLSDRLGAIEDRLDVIERKMQERPAMLRSVRAEYRTNTSTGSQSASTLPDGLAPLYQFYHGVPANAAKRLLEAAGVNIIRGHWIAGGHHFDKALDETGQRLAYEALHTHPRFAPCPDCPHEVS